MKKFEPGYIKLYKSGELAERVSNAGKFISPCKSCPSCCGIDRAAGILGKCFSGLLPVVSSYTPHFGEEPVLSGINGAGNIFFGNCNLSCSFCQNFEISQNWRSEKVHEISTGRLADIMLELQNKKCHNIGLVSPTHFSAPILESISLAVSKGLIIPIIYNSNGYDSVEILGLYDGIIDIYLPDFKYGDNATARKYSKVENYFDSAKEAIKEMYRQVGDQLIYEDGILVRGLIIRHLILPNGLSESENIFKFISEELSRNVHISLMSQYYPANQAHKDILINRTIRESEYEKVINLMDKYGLHQGWTQEISSNEYYRPNFKDNRGQPF